jgi:hypothetical protein
MVLATILESFDASSIVAAKFIEDFFIHASTSAGRSGVWDFGFGIDHFKLANSLFVDVSNRFTTSLNSVCKLFSSIFFSKFLVSLSKAFQSSFLSLTSSLLHCNHSLIFLSSLFASSIVIFFSDRFCSIGTRSSFIFSKISCFVIKNFCHCCLLYT